MSSMTENDERELCLIIKYGIEANIALGQHLLEKALMEPNVNIKNKLTNVLLSHIALPTIKKFCTPYLGEKQINNWNKSFITILDEIDDAQHQSD